MGLHLEQLEEMLFNKAIPRSRFVLGLSTALQVLCKKYNIAVEGTGKKGQWVKVDCLKAIDILVSLDYIPFFENTHRVRLERALLLSNHGRR